MGLFRNCTKLGLVALLSLIVASGSANAKGPFGSIHVAGWSGGAYTDGDTGKFSNCIASASYKSGIYFGVMVSPDYDWTLAFAHPNWKMNVGQAFPIVLTFDNRQTITVTGRVVKSDLVIVSMPVKSELVRAFRAARIMSAFAQGSLFQFNLTGTSILIPSLVSCVKTMKAGGVAAAGDFTVRPTPTRIPQMGPAQSNPSVASGGADKPKENHVAEATVIAANLLSQAGISGFRLVTTAELPDIKADAAWVAGDVVGTIDVMPSLQSKDLNEVKGILIGGDAKTCKGTFFSGSIADEDGSKDEAVTRVFTTCQEKKNPNTSYYLAVPRKAGGMYILRTMTAGKTEAPAKDADASIRKAVFTAIPK